MPELPEVEVTARSLDGALRGARVEEVRVRERRLRWPVPTRIAGAMRGERLEGVGRRGKYLLWRFAAGTALSHLGMSGTWRLVPRDGALPARHDHVEIGFGTQVAVFNDPRRFGALLWHPAGHGDVLDHPLLAGLGIEPFDPAFGGACLRRSLRGLRAPIKQVLLAGRAVVGVGNIYATESLFEARIHPAAPAGSLGAARCDRLAAAIQGVLERAIRAGGSTLRDFSGVDGIAGAYTVQALAYGREGEPCPRCARPLRRIVQGARATYYCPRCQRR